jgi:hypothetical protein
LRVCCRRYARVVSWCSGSATLRVCHYDGSVNTFLVHAESLRAFAYPPPRRLALRHILAHGQAKRSTTKKLLSDLRPDSAAVVLARICRSETGKGLAEVGAVVARNGRIIGGVFRGELALIEHANENGEPAESTPGLRRRQRTRQTKPRLQGYVF